MKNDKTELDIRLEEKNGVQLSNREKVYLEKEQEAEKKVLLKEERNGLDIGIKEIEKDENNLEKENNYEIKQKMNEKLENIKEDLIINKIKIVKIKRIFSSFLSFILSFYLSFLFMISKRRKEKIIKKGKVLGKNKISSNKNKLKEEILKINRDIKYNIRNNYNIHLIIIIYFIQITLSNNNLYFIESKFSNITLKINGIGNKHILDASNTIHFPRKNYPDIIYINGENKSIIASQYKFNQTDNLVQLIWYNNIDDCNYMFYQ